MAVTSLKKELSKRLGFKSNILIALAAFWVNFCLLGVLRSNAVIYRALVDVFHVKREDAAWPSGIFGFFMCVTGALSGFLTHHISIRNLAVIGAILASVSVSTCSLASEMHHIVYLYGALQGIGVGIIVPLTHVVLNKSFTKYRAFALGIAYSGSSLGSFVFPPVTNVLLYTYGLDGTFLLLGSIMLNSLVGAILFNASDPEREKENKQYLPQCATLYENSNKQNNCSIVQNGFVKYESDMKDGDRLNEKSLEPVLKRSLTNRELYADQEERGTLCNPKSCCKSMPSFKMAIEILSSPHFLIVSAAYAVYFSTSAIFLMVVMDFAKDRDVDLEDSVYLVSAFSIGDFAGRLSFGWIADTQFVKRNVLVRIYLLAMGILTSCLPICPVPSLPVFSVMLGLLNGSVIVNHSVLLNEYLGLEKLPLAVGFSTCIVGMSAFVRPIIIGLFRDRHESYDHLFVFVGLLQVSITVIWFAGTLGLLIRRRFFVNKIVE
ncbi:monocarboxylate transporter 12-like [Argiope bruennichi]|uniref:monocarboxylate transporter 12-like n=1 Tax=Argiope bruennichi TaxID=94029 RepID=UPI002494D7D0|nr:monocarboxylate transporter 12-like [Argiope bruennichi]